MVYFNYLARFNFHRLYGEERVYLDNTLTDIVVSLRLNSIMSTPKIYGIFKYGRLEEYIDVTLLITHLLSF